MGLRAERWQLPPFVKRLIWWAEDQFRRLKPQPDGGTLQDAYDSFRRQTGAAHKDDRESINRPDAVAYLFEWFWECAQGRPIGPEGVQLPLPSAEICAWASLGKLTLQTWEVTALRALDAAYLRIAAEK